MKVASRITLIFALLIVLMNVCIAQDQPLNKEYKQEVIEKLSQLMNDFYVYPEVAKETSVHLKSELKAGHFDEISSNDAFASALTSAVQSVNKDKHMRIWAERPYEAPENSPERMLEEHLGRMDRSRSANYGFTEVKILDGNVGYLDLRGFAGLENGKAVADAYMKLMSRTDAIIIDVSKNGGGSPRMVQYLCSYFFDEKVHLNSLYWREEDFTEEFWTLDEVGGSRMPDVPLFVITSNRTFSGAEEFSYNMQTQKRATLIGQTTGGGANPGGGRRINDKLSVFIPTGRAINPITKTSWEGVGVVPEVETTPEDAFTQAHSLAKDSAEDYRAKRNKDYTTLFMDLNEEFENFNKGKSDEAILQGLTKCKDAKLFQEWDINILGYDYLMQHNKPYAAQSIFKANTILFPNSANVYDSYAESLMATGDLESSLVNYQKAVEVAAKNNDGNLEIFKRNLENAKSKIMEKK